ncbi:hypothetical protein OUZ56_027366 [Daphnia magna]|uniref:Uncharacterized protein n=1 Tax=Daphnia magna TaxID=35525 RepID=A0ABQ9ZPK1_9CRUS|nr:hypothetical protein OUZ56_027363 [Daphnia magna]KAK4014856.1 hypothetical protein OUZ56_027366 [Daphnia magna]
MSLVRLLAIFAICLVICSLNVEANSISIPSASRGQRSVDEEAYFMDDAEEGQDEMEERQVETSVEAKRINKLWKKANPIAWTIKRL